ncbi:hypothetical protein [Hydrococcus rivularis]|uniref:hypothetical protein n=1 Tax=Hydrococcus rivularis TaxID=1616834 RepID=UPI001114905A|nr:hypothetical protein [Hydrococcus rivularis]
MGWNNWKVYSLCRQMPMQTIYGPTLTEGRGEKAPGQDFTDFFIKKCKIDGNVADQLMLTQLEVS